MSKWNPFRKNKPEDEAPKTPQPQSDGAGQGGDEDTPPASSSAPKPDQPEKEKKKGFFGKFKQALQKTVNVLNTDLRDIVKEGRLVDDEFLEEIFALMIRTDMGVSSASKIRDDIGKKFRARKVEFSDLIGSAKETVREIMHQGDADVNLADSGPTVIMVVGVNGAGKTTSFYMIVGLVALDAGDIVLDGEHISRLPIHQRARMGLSYLPQEASVFRKLNVQENIRAVLELQEQNGKKLSQDEVNRRLDGLLDDLQIAHLRDNPALSLSGGERRRVEIARALASSPRFILLDEPFAGVDPIAVGEIQRIVSFLKDRNIGVLITDHNVRETLGICDHAYIISEGTVLAAGMPEQIIENEDVRKVYLGDNFRM